MRQPGECEHPRGALVAHLETGATMIQQPEGCTHPRDGRGASHSSAGARRHADRRPPAGGRGEDAAEQDDHVETEDHKVQHL